MISRSCSKWRKKRRTRAYRAPKSVDELATLKEHTDALELETLMRGDYDDNDAVLSLHAGAGGTEAQDWTSMLYRMYTRYCEKDGLHRTRCWICWTATKPASNP